MPESMNHLKTVVLVAIASILLTTATGCATSKNTTMPAMFGASCSPASQGRLVTSKNVSTVTMESDVDVQSNAEVNLGLEADLLTPVMFTPLFSATCQPDQRMSYHTLALALAFDDHHPPVKFDHLPMFKSTAAPGSRAMHQATRIDLIVDAD